ncbi:MAG: hypothetical protein JWM53_3216 [bacterium]|nr:hypothetical protein [bacterium]
MASGEHPRDAHPEPTPPDDDAAPADTRASDEDMPPENGAAHDAREEGEPRDKRGRLEGFIPDIVKRTFYAGLGAVFTTEEGIRKIASDLKLPKDVANYLIQQAASSKDELFRVVGKEMRGFLETVNISGELQKLLTSLSFEIKTEIRFIPNDEAVSGVKPDIKVGRMSFRRNKDRDKDEAAAKKPGDKDEA